MYERRFDGGVDRLRSPERVERLEVERVVDLSLEEGQFSTVLDVGTGSGLFAGAFASRGLTVAGVDVNPEMLPVARKFIPDGDFHEGTAESLPFPDHLFDFVFLGLVLHETDNPLKALQEARRVAAKRVCILEWPSRNQTFGPPLTDRMSLEVLVDLFQQAGFTKWKMVDLTDTLLYILEV